MRPVIVIPCFAPVRLVEETLSRLRQTVAEADAVHFLLDNHYPLNGDADRRRLKSLCLHHALNHFDSGEDRGCCPNLNRWAETVGKNWADDQVVVTYDPDASPDKPGWLSALVTALAPGDIAGCSLMVPEVQVRVSQWPSGVRGGVRLVFPTEPQQMHATGWLWGAVRAAGGWQEPHQTGGLESHMWPMWQAQGRRIAYLVDFADGMRGSYPPHLIDSEYLRWIRDIRCGATSAPFGEWLRTARTTLRIGLDLDGTVYSHPGFFAELIESMSVRGHKFYCISSHGRSEWEVADVPRLTSLGVRADLISPELMHHERHGHLAIKGRAADRCDLVFDNDERLKEYTRAKVMRPL